jgi:peptidoglycan/xylan/chitin deacetylase (PgdA/CDA1 family)
MSMREISILCYHGIVDKIPDGFNYSGKHLDVKEFKKQIEFLTKNFEIITMRQIENYLQGKKDIPKKSIALTFDDGYANNTKYAEPVLKDLGAKATLYLATGYIGTGKLMWSDEIELAILTFPSDNFKLRLDKEIFFNISTLENRHLALREIKTYLKKSLPEKIYYVLQELKKLARISKFSIDADLHSFLSWDDVRSMHSSNIWEIGAHTVDHYSLGVLSPRVGINQIRNSVNRVKDELNIDYAPLFSYPEGREFDMPLYASEFLKDIGLKSAPSALPGRNNLTKLSKKRAMRLKRYLVGFESLSFPWKI